ncbi:hypothetical protein [Glutamicibacter soli]|uniref:hypothetical protein n=1 Tax=Glutamicibacter soli TaxID=453836 RepID=UPI003FD342D2
MGHRNLDLYYQYWADHPTLGHVAQRMLAYICHRCSDDDVPPVYFQGWEYLAMAAGITRGSARINTVKASVRRALRELKEAGALVASEQAGPGVRENYALTLDPKLTFAPNGFGRDVSWDAADRDISISKGDTGGIPNGDTGGIPNGDTGGIPNGDTGGIPNGDTGHIGMEIQEAPKRGYKAYLPKEDLTNSKESSIEYGSPKSPKAPNLRVVSSPAEFEDDPPLTQEQERNRQAAALRELMKNEPAASEPEW